MFLLAIINFISSVRILEANYFFVFSISLFYSVLLENFDLFIVIDCPWYNTDEFCFKFLI